MAASQVEVFNLALTKLGQDRATSPTDDVEAVRVLASLWDLARDCVLADHPWRFAIKRDSLPALTAAPAFGWARQFALPESCLRIVQVGDDWLFYTQDTASFTIEAAPSGARAILTDEGAPLQVRYVQRVTNVGVWPPLFCRAVAMQLAADACEKLTQSNTKFEAAMAAYALAIRQAKAQNAIELPPTREPESAWLRSRGG